MIKSVTIKVKSLLGTANNPLELSKLTRSLSLGVEKIFVNGFGYKIPDGCFITLEDFPVLIYEIAIDPNAKTRAFDPLQLNQVCREVYAGNMTELTAAQILGLTLEEFGFKMQDYNLIIASDVA